jgi:hypothetical protein
MKTHRMPGFVLILLAAFTTLLTACGGGGANTPVPQNNSTSGLQFTITGDVQHIMNVTSSTVGVEEAAGTQRLQLYFQEGSEYAVLFLLPLDPEGGEYTIGANGIEASLLDYTGDSTRIFTGTSGTLTVNRVDNTFSGSFEFTAETNELTGDEGLSVNVSGSFSNLVLQSDT